MKVKPEAGATVKNETCTALMKVEPCTPASEPQHVAIKCETGSLVKLECDASSGVAAPDWLTIATDLMERLRQAEERATQAEAEKAAEAEGRAAAEAKIARLERHIAKLEQGRTGSCDLNDGD